jgi:hypothetical protein
MIAPGDDHAQAGRSRSAPSGRATANRRATVPNSTSQRTTCTSTVAHDPEVGGFGDGRDDGDPAEREHHEADGHTVRSSDRPRRRTNPGFSSSS